MLCIPVSARPSGSGWTARALLRPSAWANADSVTVVSLSLAGRPLPCDCLPATLRVGYNHASAREGAVFEAAKAGDLPALQAALDAGGSTEESNLVCAGEGGQGPPHTLPAVPLRHFCGRVASLPPTLPLNMATSRPSALS